MARGRSPLRAAPRSTVFLRVGRGATLIRGRHLDPVPRARRDRRACEIVANLFRCRSRARGRGPVSRVFLAADPSRRVASPSGIFQTSRRGRAASGGASGGPSCRQRAERKRCGVAWLGASDRGACVFVVLLSVSEFYEVLRALRLLE